MVVFSVKRYFRSESPEKIRQALALWIWQASNYGPLTVERDVAYLMNGPRHILRRLGQIWVMASLHIATSLRLRCLLSTVPFKTCHAVHQALTVIGLDPLPHMYVYFLSPPHALRDLEPT